MHVCRILNIQIFLQAYTYVMMMDGEHTNFNAQLESHAVIARLIPEAILTDKWFICQFSGG